MPTNINTMPPVTRGTRCVPPKNTPGSNLEFGSSRKKNKHDHPPPSDTADNNSIACDSNKRNKKNESNKEKHCNNANKQSQIRSVSPTTQNTNT